LLRVCCRDLKREPQREANIYKRRAMERERARETAQDPGHGHTAIGATRS
jgi:hypothetical protein